MFYVFFWVIPLRLNFICRRFGTLCLFHLHRQIDVLAYEDGTECSETSAYKIQTPGNYLEENIQQWTYYLCLLKGFLINGYAEKGVAQSVSWLCKGLEDRRGVLRFPAGQEVFSASKRPDRLWTHPASSSAGTWDAFPGEKVAWAWSWPRTYISCLC